MVGCITIRFLVRELHVPCIKHAVHIHNPTQIASQQRQKALVPSHHGILADRIVGKWISLKCIVLSDFRRGVDLVAYSVCDISGGDKRLYMHDLIKNYWDLVFVLMVEEREACLVCCLPPPQTFSKAIRIHFQRERVWKGFGGFSHILKHLIHRKFHRLSDINRQNLLRNKLKVALTVSLNISRQA
jgi:hypothetical protein